MSWKEKIRSNDQLRLIAEEIRRSKKSIATLNGSFDLLHAGHLYMLREAKKQADFLFLALNTDRSIREYKGEDRPIVSLEYRLQLIASLQDVDYVTWFDETTPIRFLSEIKPDVHVNGSEYGDKCIEADTVRENGGRLHIVKRIPGLSTSQIIEKIRGLCASSVT